MLSVLTNTHMLMAAQGRRASSRFFYSSSACVYAAEQPDRPRRHGAQRGRRLPGHARGRLRLGEAVQRADVPPLPRGLRHRHPCRPLPQRVRPARAPGTAAARRRRPRSAARSIDGQAPGDHRSRSGATASRRAPSCTSTTASRDPQMLTDSDVVEPLNLGSVELVTINQLVDIVEEIAGIESRAPLQPRRAAGRPRPQQRQHPDPGAPGLGAVDQPARRTGAHLPLDPRPDGRGRSAGS